MSDDTNGRHPAPAPSVSAIVFHGEIHGEVDGERAPDMAAPEPASIAVSPAVAWPTVPPPAPPVPAPPPAQPSPAATGDRLGQAAGSAVPDVGPSPAEPAVAAPGAPAPEPKRATNLDALRGLFLVLMTMGFALAANDLPLWMYHRQMPPPTFEIIDLAGISWRDLAYAAFIFTMAAALPITLSRRIEKGESRTTILLAALRRFLLLFVFALLIGHSDTYFTGYTQVGRAIGVLGFVIMFMLFVRRRSDWNPIAFKIVRGVGWVGAAAFLALTPLLYGKTFTPTRIDTIISALAFVALSGSLVWYFTRDSIARRMVLLAAVAVLFLRSLVEGWVQEWWWVSPAPWLFQPARLSLLLLVIPGTIAGDLLLRGMRGDGLPPGSPDGVTWGKRRVALLSLVCFLCAPFVVAGSYNRWTSATAVAALALCTAALLLSGQAATARERMLQQLVRWGTVWLIVGLLVEPYEGGIRRVPETLSYFLVVAGLTTLLLVTLTTLLDLGRKKLLQPLADVGTNPMLGYVMFSLFLNSILGLIPPLRSVLDRTPGEAVLRMILSTIAAVLIVRAFTRHRIFWRA